MSKQLQHNHSAKGTTANIIPGMSSTAPVALSAKRTLVRLARNMGWRLNRLNGKIPIDKGWTTSNGLSSPEALQHSGNLGILCGEPSGRLFIVDIDGERPEGLPETPTVKSGGGGLHLYYHLPDDVVLVNANKICHVAPGVDIRWTGGQIVAPGSIHPGTGRLYNWLPGYSPNKVAFADVPQWIIDKLQPSKVKP